MADGFGKESQDIMVSFDGLRTLFGSFTGSFNSWATEAEKKLDADMDKITKEIDKLKDEIEEYRGLMVKYGVIGGIATVGVTAGLCVFLGPFGLVGISSAHCVFSVADLKFSWLVSLVPASPLALWFTGPVRSQVEHLSPTP